MNSPTIPLRTIVKILQSENKETSNEPRITVGRTGIVVKRFDTGVNVFIDLWPMLPYDKNIFFFEHGNYEVTPQ